MSLVSRSVTVESRKFEALELEVVFRSIMAKFDL